MSDQKSLKYIQSECFCKRMNNIMDGCVKTYERYLRNDIHCGFSECKKCQSIKNSYIQNIYPQNDGYVLIPDYRIIDKYIPLIQHYGDIFSDLLFLSSFVKEISSKSSVNYNKKFSTLLNDPSRHSVIFSNDSHCDTYVPRTKGMTIEEKRLEELCATYKWYENHLHDLRIERNSKYIPIQLYILTDNTELYTHLQSLHIHVFTIPEYIHIIEGHRDIPKTSTALLLEEYNHISDSFQELDTSIPENDDYSREFTESEAIEELKQGKCLQGKLKISNYCVNEAFVTVRTESLINALKYMNIPLTDTDIDLENEFYKIHINGYTSIRPAIHGDRVILKIIEQSRWNNSIQDGVENTREDDDNGGIYFDEKSTHICARVIYVYETVHRPFICTIHPDYKNSNSNKSQTVLLVPRDCHIPLLRYTTAHVSSLSSMYLIISIGEWGKKDRYPTGIYVGTAGIIGSLEGDTKALVYEHQLSRHLTPFSPAVMKCLPPVQNGLEYTIPPEEYKNRLDITNTHNVVSIDPPGCVDIDDALSVRVLDDGVIEIGVHIADVCYYIHNNSPIDLEARLRSTSVYLIDRRLDMLPSLLSSDLCSLRANHDRLALSIFWYFDPITFRYDPSKTRYTRTVLRSRYSMAYFQAQNIHDNLPPGSISSDIPAVVGKVEEDEIGQADSNDCLDTMNLNSHGNKKKMTENLSNPMGNKELYKSTGSPIDSKDLPWLKRDIDLLMKIASSIRSKRRDDGAIEFTNKEYSFTSTHIANRYKNSKTDGRIPNNPEDDEHLPTNIDIPKNNDDPRGNLGDNSDITLKASEHMDIHETVEEYMILANREVAQYIYETFPNTSLLRHHNPPPATSLNNLQQISEYLHIPLHLQSNKDLAESIKTAEIQQKGTKFDMLKTMCIYSMSEAEYICTGCIENQEELKHYGLGIDYYTHYTSPIRRYADVLVHRILLLAIEKHNHMKQQKAIDDIPHGLSEDTLNSLIHEHASVNDDGLPIPLARLGPHIGHILLDPKQQERKRLDERIQQHKQNKETTSNPEISLDDILDISNEPLSMTATNQSNDKNGLNSFSNNSNTTNEKQDTFNLDSFLNDIPMNIGTSSSVPIQESSVNKINDIDSFDVIDSLFNNVSNPSSADPISSKDSIDPSKDTQDPSIDTPDPSEGIILSSEEAYNSIDITEQSNVRNTIEQNLDLFSTEQLKDIATHINNQHRQAKYIGFASKTMYLIKYIQSRDSVEVKGIITAINRKGFKVFIPFFEITIQLYIINKENSIFSYILSMYGLQNPQTELVPFEQSLFATNSQYKSWIFKEKGKNIIFNIYDELTVSINCNEKNELTQEYKITAELRSSTQNSNSTIQSLNQSNNTISGEKWNPLNILEKPTVIQDPSWNIHQREAFMNSIKQLLSTSKPKNVVGEKSGTRISFGNFYTPKKGASLYENERPLDSLDSIISKKSDTNYNQMEYDALSRQRKLVTEKRHDRINSKRKEK